MKTLPKILACALVSFLICCPVRAENSQGTEKSVSNMPTSDDKAKINDMLANYVHSVSTGDRALFESQLLDLNIPFAAIGAQAQGAKNADLKSIQDYPGFRKAIFENGDKFQQRFSNIKIEQVGNLAQVSLDYETALQGAEYSGKGWKVLQLIKTLGHWKIASEFFTGYPNQ